MGIILKLGPLNFYRTYFIWNLFKIQASKECITYMQKYKPTEICYDEVKMVCTPNIYLCFFIKNIEIIKQLGLIGIYHLLIINNSNGIYVYNKTEEIFKMLNIIFTHEEDTQNFENITPYMDLFQTSFLCKQNIYIL